MGDLLALSIRQPWAWAILHAGKDIENRDWQDGRSPSLAQARRIIAGGGHFLIHAAKGMTGAEYEDFIDAAHNISRVQPFPTGLRVPPMKALDRGGIVGRARLTGIVNQHASPWFFGRIGLVLADVEPLPFLSCKGMLGFFRPKTETP